MRASPQLVGMDWDRDAVLDVIVVFGAVELGLGV
jgi:hypothetical protein